MNVDDIIKYHKEEAQAAIAERKKGLIDYDPLRHTSAKADFHKQSAEIIRVLCREMLSNTWQDIATAPKDRLLLLSPGDCAMSGFLKAVKVGGWLEGEGHLKGHWSVFGASWEPKFWQELPDAPSGDSDQ